ASRMELNPAQKAAIARFQEFAERARDDLAVVERSVSEGKSPAGRLEAWAEQVFRELRLEEALRAEASGDRAGEIRVENLRDFIASIGAYERRTWAEAPLPDEEADWSPPSLHGFLEQVSLFSENETSEDARDDSPDEVTLLTLHSA